MKLPLACAAIAILLAGCSSGRISRYDPFEKVRVERLCANAVSRPVLGRTVVCLNAAVESLGFMPLTNTTVCFVTNPVVTATTNLTVTTIRQHQVARLTNAVVAAGSTATNAAETTPPDATAPAAAPAGGLTTTHSRNESLSLGPNQSVRAASTQITTMRTEQTNAVHEGISVSHALNEVVTSETNQVVTLVTNLLVTPETNVTVRFADTPVLECYLFTEIAPPDFPLMPGESLVVLADGARYACTNAVPRGGWRARRGFLTTWYRVSPEVLLAIARAREVQLRIKGSNGTLERTLNRASHQRLREFVAETLEPKPPSRPTKTPRLESSRHASHLNRLGR